MTLPTGWNQDQIIGVAIGEAMVNSLIRLEIGSDTARQAALDVVDYYLRHANEVDEVEMFDDLKLLMKKASTLLDDK
ncbi:MAG: hypothetical protein WC869_01310 [Phycisphaerae bacterium]|jgi:hypothetical protein